MEYLEFFTAVSIGLLGGAHCIGMCGGVIGALTMAVDARDSKRRLTLIVAYNMGRISSYVLIAVLFFLLVDQLESYFALSIMRNIAGLLLIAMGLYIANWWRGLVYLEKLGAHLWRWIQPLSKTLVPVRTIWHALLLGLLWGWLPCGLIYSALVYSATASNVGQAALIMFGFALGTLPTVLLGSFMAERFISLIKAKNVRVVMALLMIIFGVWTIINNHNTGSDHQVSSRSDKSTVRSISASVTRQVQNVVLIYSV
ncbi:MAG: sulfite exporter TauE/SafE [Pseudohongiellaceae bacterium]|jgi:sulfite exporter TauE/SafE